MTDLEFAIVIRRMLLAIVAKIEQRYKLGKHAESAQEERSDITDSFAGIV
jgi:hypothetical protein